MSDALKNLKRRYPQLTNFKKVSTYDYNTTNLKPFINYMKENPKKCFDVIMHEDIFFTNEVTDVPYYSSFTILDKDFAFVYKRNIFDRSSCCYVFFNDYNLIKEKFFKEDIRKYAPGTYELQVVNHNYTLIPMDIKYVESPILDEKISKQIHKDIDCFFDNKKFYNDNNLPRKRGLIVHGPHGNGKTTLVKDVVTQYNETYRVFVDCRLFDQGLSEYLAKVFPEDKDKILVFEDVESISEGGSRSYSKRSSFLNFIDGPKTMENTLFIATTNHPDLVDPALIDRPSRFDRVYKVSLPNKECRKRFLLKYFPELEENKEELTKCVLDTKDFSGAYFKELFIVVGVQKSTLAEAIADLRKQIKVRREGKFDESKPMGLGGSYDEEDDY
jgi:hypothetical protein